MSDIDYTKFRLSLKRLEEQYDNYVGMDDTLSQLNQEAIGESTIQCFETCFDTLWKILERYLNEEVGLPDLPNGPKPLFKIAAENQLFRTPLEKWLAYNDSRIATSHDYDGIKAQKCLDIIGSFIDDAVGLYEIMTGKPWE